jgi:HAD superfamily hydrolase (TIGR01450 family)
MIDNIPEITIEILMDRYDVILFDAYGVLVHSEGAFPGAVELIQWLNRVGKPYYILTNDASKLPTTAAMHYQGYGLLLDSDRIITSGALLTPYFATHHLKGARCAVLGPVDSVRYVEQAGGRVVSPADVFDVLVIADEAGFPFLETVDMALTSLCRALDRQQEVHLILPNPDIIYPNAAQGFGFGAGSIAGMFETALQVRYPHRTDLHFTRLGKPQEALFLEALSRSDTRNMVMLGDQLETDIQGARAFGIDAVWVGTGVMAEVLSTAPAHLRPTYRLRSL